MNDVTTYGLDLAKQVMQVHWVDRDTGEIHRKRLARAAVSAFFARAVRGRVVMEACGSAHHWGRVIASLGHEVRLIAAQFVRPFVKTNKTDAADAQAIWVAAHQPEMRFVALKSEAQQAVLALHRLRSQWLKIRTMQANQIRAVLYEFGAVVPLGWRMLLKRVPEYLVEGGPVPVLLHGELREQLEALRVATARIAALDARIDSWQRNERDCQRIAAIPGVGSLTASAVVASVGDARQFRSGREFAAYLGLVPKQSGTGGRVQLLGISKRGDAYLRTLFVQCARSLLISHSRGGHAAKDVWLSALLKRRPSHVAAVALANKMARTIWALLAYQRTFDATWRRPPVVTMAN